MGKITGIAMVVALMVMSTLFTLSIILLWFSAPSRVGISEALAWVAQLEEDKDVLVIDGFDHPPWAQVHFVAPDFDYDKNTITIIEWYVRFNPFASYWAHGRWPLVIRNGLLPGTYSVRYWNGEKYVLLGRLEVSDDRSLDFIPADGL